MNYVVGIDEAGRGPLAGPICAAAIAFPPNVKHSVFNIWGKGGIRDSKKLSEIQREKIFAKLQELKKKRKVDFAAAMVGAVIIDRIGISRATALAVARALKKLSLIPSDTKILLDGLLHAPKIYQNQKTIIKGDEKEPLIALASIVAKVKRDRKMRRLSKKYPKYGLYKFEIHKGYGTALHLKMIRQFGLSSIHRRSFCSNLRFK